MNKQMEGPERELIEKDIARNIPADAIFMGEGSCSVKVLLFDEREKGEKDEEN